MSINKHEVLERLLNIGTLNPPDRNNISAYLPYRNKGADFDYAYVAGSLISRYYGVKLSAQFSTDKLEKKCLGSIGEKTIDGDLFPCLKDIYFAEGNLGLTKLAPKFLLLHTEKKGRKVSSSSKHLETIFNNFIEPQDGDDLGTAHYNFLEKPIVESFDQYLNPVSKSEISSHPYLPFLKRVFSRDLDFLTSKPSYLLDKIEDFLAIYTFLYCSQLTKNIRGWASGEPQTKPCYFIIDTEKCSAERKAADSYKELAKSLENVFPILTMLDEINGSSVLGDEIPTLPLWEIVDCLKDVSAPESLVLIDKFQSYIDKFSGPKERDEEENIFCDGRNLKTRSGAEYEGLIGKVNLLFQYAMDQFDEKREWNPTSKHEMKIKYKKPFEQEVAKHFVQSRGRLGKILVVNQDYLLMLTNLVIADQEKLRLQEILNEFEKRGIYFDKQSELSLISFYERIGNIERMSDSGDAVYVKSTI